MKFNVIHKVRFDRGRIYYSYLNSIFTALLVYIFTQGNWVTSVLSAFTVIAVIYLFGLLDQKLSILKREQKIYAEHNPVLMQILKELEKLNESIGNNNSV